MNDNQPISNMTVYPSGTGDYYWPYPWNVGQFYSNTIFFPMMPTDCSGDVHVFACSHCKKCKCGGATKAAK